VATKSVLVNRAPVLTLWAAVVAERLGYDWEEALTLGKSVAGLNAQSKGRRLGIYEKAPAKKTSHVGEKPSASAAKKVVLLGREVPTVKTAEGIRAVVKDRPENPAAVQRYLEQKFGGALPEVTEAMRTLAKTHTPKQIEEAGFSLYEAFRPQIPRGTAGWGAKGRLELDRIHVLVRE
jgi:hypothetical protein